jgi:hypothetical protein
MFGSFEGVKADARVAPARRQSQRAMVDGAALVSLLIKSFFLSRKLQVARFVARLLISCVDGVNQPVQYTKFSTKFSTFFSKRF